MEVFYTPPPTPRVLALEDATGGRSERAPTRAPVSVHGSIHSLAHSSAQSSAQGSAMGSRSSLRSASASAPASAGGSDADDDNALEDLERNIASLERSLQNKDVVIDMESGDESRARKLKIAGKRFLR